MSIPLHFGRQFGRKQKIERRIDICIECGNMSELSFYEANEYYQISFIPLIPLGKKKILRHCSHCGIYAPMSLKKWYKLKEDTLKHAKRTYETCHNNEEALIQLYSSVYSICSNREVDEFGRTIKTRFPYFKKLETQLSNKIFFIGNSESAISMLKDRISINSQDHNSIYILGWTYFQNREYEKAKDEFMKINPIKTRKDFSNLIDLAKKLSGESRYDILKQIVKFEKHFSKTHDLLNRLIIASETKLGIPKNRSIVGEEYYIHRKKDIRIASIIVIVLLAAGSLIYNYKYNHIKLYILNGNQESCNLIIENFVDTIIPSNEFIVLNVKPNSYNFQLIYSKTESRFDLQLELEIIDFLIKSPIFVLNPNGAAVVINEELIYSNLSHPSEGKFKILTGKEYYYFGHIDYAFEDIPVEISTDKAEVSKYALTFLNSDPKTIVHYLLNYEKAVKDSTIYN